MKTFSRTSIFNLVKLFTGVAALFGILIAPDVVMGHIDIISESVLALWIIFDGAFGVYLRKLTSTRLRPGSVIKKV